MTTWRHVLPDVAGHVELSAVSYSSTVVFKSRFHWFKVMLSIVVQDRFRIRLVQNSQKVVKFLKCFEFFGRTQCFISSKLLPYLKLRVKLLLSWDILHSVLQISQTLLFVYFCNPAFEPKRAGRSQQLPLLF